MSITYILAPTLHRAKDYLRNYRPDLLGRAPGHEIRIVTRVEDLEGRVLRLHDEWLELRGTDPKVRSEMRRLQQLQAVMRPRLDSPAAVLAYVKEAVENSTD